MKTLVYLEEVSLRPVGGPVAVGYYYKKEIEKNKDNSIEFLRTIGDEQKAKAIAVMNKLPKWMNKFLFSIRTVIATKRILKGTRKAPLLDLSKYDILFFHETLQMWLMKDQLSEYQGKVILQSHSPVPLAQEICDGMPRLAKMMMPNRVRDYEKMDIYAFERADYIIFPCKEAEEPYELLWPYYKTIQKNRKDSYRYLLTGIEKCSPNRTKSAVRKELDIPMNDFVLSYIGRHNKTKGFDLLKEMASVLLQENENLWVISAGKEEPIKRLEHPRWHEVGFTKDAHSYIAASDIFVLPNRMTYFDIVMLEVLSLGKVVVASRTGGNRFFEKQELSGVFLYDNIDEAVQIINKLKNLPKDTLDELGASNKEYFETHLTSDNMYKQYKKMLENLDK